jgi:hypothetical protein
LLICFECFVSSVGLEHNDIWHTEEANVRPSLSDRSHKSSKKVLNTLMKRTFAHLWAIVRLSVLNKAADTEEANDRTSLGDRSLTRQAPVDERSSPAAHAHAHATAPRENDRPAVCDRSHTGYPAPRDLFRSRPSHIHHFHPIIPTPHELSFTPPTFGEA